MNEEIFTSRFLVHYSTFVITLNLERWTSNKEYRS